LGIIIGCILIVGIIVISYCYYPKSVNNPKLQDVEVNLCLHIWDYSDTTIFYLKDLNVKWVRTDWVNAPDKLMLNYSQTLQDTGINHLAIIDVNTFNNQNFTLEEWNTTVTEIVNSDGFNNTDAVEIWNEPNGKAYIPPLAYYEMLKSAYVIIKNYSSIPVVFAGVSPNVDDWQNYLEEVFANENVENYYDYMGIHLYDDPQTNFNTLNFIKGLTGKHIWLTETGYPSINNETEQATYLQTIYETLPSQVSKIFIYEMYDGQGAQPPKENYFGLLAIDGAKKEAYTFIRNISLFDK
jgi:hypothetical protein